MRRSVKYFLITFFLITICNIHLCVSSPILKWSHSTGDVSGYLVYYGLSQGDYSFSEDVGNVTEYSLDNLSLNEGTTYYFVVRAYNTFGESGNSNAASYTVPSAEDTTPPMPPEGVLCEIVNSDILLTWQTNSEDDFSFYSVYYGTSSRDYGLPISVNGTEYSMTGLDDGVTYYFSVTAVDTSNNESGFSSPETIVTMPTDAVDTSDNESGFSSPETIVTMPTDAVDTSDNESDFSSPETIVTMPTDAVDTSDNESGNPFPEIIKAIFVAAEQGQIDSQNKLGVMFYKGEVVAQNFKRAFYWFRQAAEQGHVGAQNRLGVMFYKGEGVTQNYKLAYVWESLAAARNHKEAIQNKNIIIKELTLQQIADAQKHIAKLKEKMSQ